jgi:hypothetical protein
MLVNVPVKHARTKNGYGMNSLIAFQSMFHLRWAALNEVSAAVRPPSEKGALDCQRRTPSLRACIQGHKIHDAMDRKTL